MLFLDEDDPIRNVKRAALTGGAPETVTQFKEGRNEAVSPSPDGRRLAIARKIGEVTNVWLTRADGTQPVQVTHFLGDEVLGMRWNREGTRLLLAAGRKSSDAVLIRQFR